MISRTLGHSSELVGKTLLTKSIYRLYILSRYLKHTCCRGIWKGGRGFEKFRTQGAGPVDRLLGLTYFWQNCKKIFEERTISILESVTEQSPRKTKHECVTVSLKRQSCSSKCCFTVWKKIVFVNKKEWINKYLNVLRNKWMNDTSVK